MKTHEEIIRESTEAICDTLITECDDDSVIWSIAGSVLASFAKAFAEKANIDDEIDQVVAILESHKSTSVRN